MKTAIITLLILAIGIFYVFTIREGHDWGDDFSMYIHHAKNIVEGTGYARIGYIQNPDFPLYSPSATPPIFPLLLVPVYALFGMNLTAMKVEVVLFFLLFLFVLYAILKDDLPFPYQLLIVGLIGLHPFFWEFKDQILSDIPFLCFVYLGLFFINRAFEPGNSETRQRLHAVFIGVLTYLAYGTRTVGIILIPSLLILSLIKMKRVSRFAWLAVLIAVSLIMIQEIVAPGGRSSVSLLLSSPLSIFANLGVYWRSLYRLWDGGYGNVISGALFGSLCLLAGIGYWTRIRQGMTSFELFGLLYAVPILLWPFTQGRRYLIPIIPLFVLYAFLAFRNVPLFQKRGIERLAASILVLAILLSYSGQYARANYGAIQEGIGRPATKELFSFITNNTDSNDIFISWKPRALTLFTDRRASIYHSEQTDEQLWSFFRVINARYLVIGPQDPPRLAPFIGKYQSSLQLVYANAEFKMYRIALN